MSQHNKFCIFVKQSFPVLNKDNTNNHVMMTRSDDSHTSVDQCTVSLHSHISRNCRMRMMMGCTEAQSEMKEDYSLNCDSCKAAVVRSRRKIQTWK